MSPGFADVRYGDWKHDIVFRTEDEDVRQDLVRELSDTMRATDWLTRHPLGSIDGMRASGRGGRDGRRQPRDAGSAGRQRCRLTLPPGLRRWLPSTRRTRRRGLGEGCDGANLFG